MSLCLPLCLKEHMGDEGGVGEGPDTAQLLGGWQHGVTRAWRDLETSEPGWM